MNAVSDKYSYLAPLPALGESSGKETGDSFSPGKALGVSDKPYATEDYGGTDYSALLQAAPQYQPTEMDKTADALVKAALEMNYTDWTKGDQYAALAERYGQQGRQSMRDILGQVSARTGGLASSYAATAAQQSYDQYMSQLEQAAMEMYGVERADALQNAQLAYQLSDRNYQRYLDQLSQYNADRSFNFGVRSDALDQSFQQEQWKNLLEQQAYQQKRDALSDQRYDDEITYGRDLDAYNQGIALRDDARARIGQYFAMGGGLDGLDPALIGQSQYTPAELEAIGRYYGPQQQLQQGQYIQQAAPAVGNPGGPAFNNGRLTSEQVKELQTYLSNGGMDIAVDGYWGPASQAASGMSADDAWTKYHSDMAEDASPGVGTMRELTGSAGRFTTYDSAISYLKQQGVDPGTPYTSSEWSTRKSSYKKTGKGDPVFAAYDTYADYISAYVQYCLEEKASKGGRAQ